MVTNSNSPVIRCVEHLKLSPEYERLANELIKQCDMPIVFWVNSELPRNFRCRHPAQKNQFWVTVRPNCTENEKLRLILGGIYGAVQEQRRYWRTDVQPEYEAKLEALHDSWSLHTYYEFLSRLGNMATTLDVEWFLSEYGIATSRSVRQFYFKDRKDRLKEYIILHDPQKTSPCITWSREHEVMNLIEYGNYYRLGAEYRRDLKKLLVKIDPNYVDEVEWVAGLIVAMQKEYSKTGGATLTEKFLEEIIKHFDLGHMVKLCKHESYKGIYPVSDENRADVLSYVLNNWPRQEDLINWLRTAREIICVYRSTMDFKAPDITMNLIETDECNSYSDGDCATGYCISFTLGLIYRLTDAVGTWEISQDLRPLIVRIGEDEVRCNLLRQVIFHITAHEYAHVINGDCDRSAQLSATDCTIVPEERRAIEINADKTARCIISQSLPFCYRFPPAPEGEHERHKAALREGGFEAMKRIISKERAAEINQEVREHQFKMIRDQMIATEALRLINQVCV